MGRRNSFFRKPFASLPHLCASVTGHARISLPQGIDSRFDVGNGVGRSGLAHKIGKFCPVLLGKFRRRGKESRHFADQCVPFAFGGGKVTSSIYETNERLFCYRRFETLKRCIKKALRYFARPVHYIALFKQIRMCTCSS